MTEKKNRKPRDWDACISLAKLQSKFYQGAICCLCSKDEGFHCLSAYMVSPAYIPIDLGSLFHNPRRQILHFYFFFFVWGYLTYFQNKTIRLSRNLSSTGICPENAGQSWGCLEYETLTGVPIVTSFRTWNQAGILLLSQGPMPFLKKRTD